MPIPLDPTLAHLSRSLGGRRCCRELRGRGFSGPQAWRMPAGFRFLDYVLSVEVG
jgi:hypothetical protein